MVAGEVEAWLAAVLLLGLRLAPTLAFAPPFSLVRTPPILRLFVTVGLAAGLVGARPELAQIRPTPSVLVTAALGEATIGLVFMLAFQVAFAGLYTAGRTIDVQAGFGLATLIDPSNRTSTPLIGSLFAYAAGAAFFAFSGHLALIQLFAASLDVAPFGLGFAPETLQPLLQLMSVVFLIGFGVAGASVLALFLADIVIGLLARTAPQINALMLGFQVKTLLLLIVLPLSFGAASALLPRVGVAALEALPRMLASG
jgi:flagellar biosynthetic protein FliR